MKRGEGEGRCSGIAGGVRRRAGVVDSTIAMQPALTTTDCVGCHSSDSETIRDLGDGTRIPIVYTANAPNLEPGTSTSMLAGGNFHWVALGDDSTGHNVFGISEIDQALSIAPGKPGGVRDPCHKSLAYPKPYPSGCTGCHLSAHHADDSPTVAPGSDVVTCIFCHRPHGSPYPDMLRWDYDSCSAGNGSSECGCYVCHTAKDQ